MALTQINSYPVSHNKGGSGGGNTYVFGGNNSTIYDTINVKNINATNGNIDYLKSKSISANDASFMFFQSSEGSIQTLMGNKLQYNTGLFGDVEADTINAKKIKTDDLESLHAYIKELQSKEITTEYLTVTKQAHFFELLIDKIRSVGGQLIITPASCIIDYVYAHTANGYVEPSEENYESIDYFDVYWKATDTSERKITNDFLANDQVICQSFNNVSEGVNYDISNKYYWRLVNSLLPDKYINLTTGAQSNSQQNSSSNDFEVILYNTTLTDVTTEADINNGISWVAAAQTIEGIETNVSWTNGTVGTGEAIHGTFSTNSQLYGMQINPDESIEVMPLTNKVHLRIRQIVENSYIIPQKMNIGFYFNDDTYIIYNNVVFDSEGNVTFEFPDINESIKGIIIVSTADVNWHFCHGMRISNTVCDNVLSGFSAIPSVGDNLVQLGYRGTDEANSQRQSAIIISSYNTIDQGGELIDGTVLRPIKAPSYAQYIGIKTFDLYKYRQSFFDAKGAAFKGDISLCSVGDETLEEALENAGRTTYLHIAYANSADGQQDFTKIPVTGVEYQYLGFCTDYNEDDEDLVYSDYQWALVPGSSGDSGDHWEFAYCNTNNWQTPPTPPAAGTTINALPQGWYKEPQPLPSGYYTWMSQCRVSGSTGIYGTWELPIRLTGDKGENGADGDEIEFIYTRNNGTASGQPNPPAAPVYDSYNRLVKEQDDWHGTDSNGIVWTDNPQGIEENLKYEYVCQRIRRLGVWGDYYPSNAAIWSSWGKKGQDGDGYEYIYKHFSTEQTFSNDNNNPAYWDAVQSDEYYGPIGYEWSDDPVGVDSTDKFEYVSVRKKISGTWGQFSTPALWSRYAAQGADGGRYINMYRQITSSTNAPDIPYVAASISTMESMGWLQTMPVQETNKFIWMTEAFFADGATSSMWSNPVRLTGDNGKPGEDGNTIEYIYKHFTFAVNWSSVSTNQNPANWSANQNPDYLGPSGYKWSDNPVGIDSTNKFEYVSTREYKLWSGDTEKKWGPFTTPVLWSNWGEKGQDGDGYEYIFKAFGAAQTFGNNNYNPAYWAASSSDKYVGPTGYEWSDDPVTLDDTNNKIEYVAVRKRVNGTWGKFTTPQIWAMYGGTGPAGADGKPITYLYKNDTSTPTISDSMASVPNMQNNDWNVSAGTPESGKYIYMTWSYMDPSNLDAPLSPGWRTPARISGPQGKNAVEYKLIDQGSEAYVNLNLDSNNKITQSMIFNLKFKVMRLEGSSMRFMQMGEMRDWPKVFSTYSNQNGFYAYALFTKGTSSTPTYNNYKMTLNTSDSDSTDALFTLEYTANVPAENTNSNYITVNNKEITVRLIEANVSSDFSNTNTTILSHTHDSFNIQVTLQSKATLNVLNDSIATLVAADTANATNISTVSQTASAIDARVQTIEGNYVTQTRYTQESDYFKWQVNQAMLNFNANNQMMVNLMGLDTTKFYPVSISLPHTQNYSRIRIQRNLDKNEYGDGPSDYGTHAASNNGFSLDLDWSAIPSGWGANWQPSTSDLSTIDWSSAYIVGKPITEENVFVARYIHKYYTGWTKDQTVGSNIIPYDFIAGNIEQNFMGSLCQKLSSDSTNTCPIFYQYLYNLANERAQADYDNDPDKSVSVASRRTTLLNQYIAKYRNGWCDEIVYLRGGSKYLIQTEYAYSVIEPCTSGYYWTTIGSDSVTYTCNRPVKNYNEFFPNKVDAMSRSEIIQTADQIELNVYDQLYEKTGIDIQSGTITLNANNTVFNGSIKMYNADDGLVIFNDQGQKAVEVIKDTIGTFGTNQNTTNHLSGSTLTCTYIVGNNGRYRMYIDQFNTSAEDNYGGYATETKYWGQTTTLPAVLRLGRHSNGEKLIFRNVQWTMEGSYSGVITDYKVKARLCWLSSDNVISWQNTWVTPNYSSGIFSITLPDYTITSTGSGYDWTLLLDFKGPNPSSNRSKSFKFNVTADLINNMSINTKIGTDGYRTVTPTSETWVNSNQITNLVYGGNTNMYGTNYKLFGNSIDRYGTNNVFGSATIDTTNGTPISNPNYIHVGCIGPLLKITGNTTYDTDANRINGAIGWESFSYNPILPRIVVTRFGIHIIPKYILVEGRHPSYSDNWHLIMLNGGTNESDYLPIGTEIYIINHSGATMYACGYNASGTANLPYCIYDDDTTSLYKAMEIINGGTFGFIHVGGGRWKPIQLYGGESSSPTNFD